MNDPSARAPITTGTTSDDRHYDQDYYRSNGQSGDRPALWFYSRLARQYFDRTLPVLDFGCGTGWLSRRLTRFFRVYSFDVSEAARRACRINAPTTTICDRTESIPDSHLGGIISLHVLEHIPMPDLRDTLAEWRRVLHPDGRVICVMPHRDALGHKLKGADWFGFRDPTHVNLLTADEWMPIFHEAGFHVIQTASDGLWDRPYRTGALVRDALAAGAVALTAAQFLVARLVIPAHWGEDIIFVLSRKVESKP